MELAVACAVAQFLDLGAKIVTTGIEVYNSASGRVSEHDQLEKETERLRYLTLDLETTRKELTTGDAWTSLIKECQSTSIQLKALLESLRVKTERTVSMRNKIRRMIHSTQQATRTAMSKTKIMTLSERLAELRSELQLHLLAMLSKQESSTQIMLNELSEKTKSIGVDLTAHLNEIHAEILAVLKERGTSSAGLETLANKLPSLLEESRAVTCQTSVLESLYFPEMRDRYNQIKDAEGTFEWMLQSSPDLRSPNVGFLEWLASEEPNDNTYWISGKPGSGKSTLMKFLYRHPQTKATLETWAGSKQLLLCGFYFWIAGGSQMLKSQLGLLRSLVFEVLKGNPALIEEACPQRYKHQSKDEVEVEAWTVNELLDTLKRATSHAKSNTRFCFFIDGLDEYEGQPQEMIYLIRQFPRSPDVKFCLASRKWNTFLAEFGENQKTRQLFLEDLTRKDIQNFVERKLRAESKFRQLEFRHQRLSQQLVRDVVEKAERVFLWVNLAVLSLIRGLINADLVEELQERLRMIPGDLPSYFSAMLGSVESLYRADAAKIYQIMMNTTEQPYLVIFKFLWDFDPEFGTKMKAEPYTLGEIRDMEDGLRPRLNARCTDLLDIVKVSSVHPMWEYKVVFLHRTVREYMESPEARGILGQWISEARGQFNPHIYICQSLVAQIKRSPLKPQYLAKQGIVSKLVEQFGHSARCVQDTLGDAQLELLNELDLALAMHRRSYAEHATTYRSSFWYSKASFLRWASKEDLNLYISARIRSTPVIAVNIDRSGLDIDIDNFVYDEAGDSIPLS